MKLDIASGAEWLLPFAKSKLRVLHNELDRGNRSVGNKTIFADSGNTVFIKALKSETQWLDSIRITIPIPDECSFKGALDLTAYRAAYVAFVDVDLVFDFGDFSKPPVITHPYASAHALILAYLDNASPTADDKISFNSTWSTYRAQRLDSIIFSFGVWNMTSTAIANWIAAVTAIFTTADVLNAKAKILVDAADKANCKPDAPIPIAREASRLENSEYPAGHWVTLMADVPRSADVLAILTSVLDAIAPTLYMARAGATLAALAKP